MRLRLELPHLYATAALDVDNGSTVGEVINQVLEIFSHHTVVGQGAWV